ncbi:MAG: hybrid sensor histidine kinase/response regulator [Hyphomonas sp.]|nr:hybrid sensor histidine kinase/response regulator [Hyphomonas sp.]
MENVQIEIHALRMLMERNRVASFLHIGVAVMVGLVASTSVPVWRCILFSVGLALPILLQMQLAAQVARENWSDSSVLAARSRFDRLALWVGCMWGFAGFFLFPAEAPARQLFLTFVMGGMSLSAVGTQGMRLRTCYSSVVPGMVPLGLRYMLEGGLSNVLSGGLILLYVVVLVSLARKINDFMLQAFRLQAEKESLLADVQRQATELEDARKLAEQANLSKSRFLAQASHDLRQPLHALSLFVETLPDAESPEEHEEILGRVRQSLDVLTKLFDSLLDVSLLDTGGIQLRPQVFRPHDLFMEVQRDFELVAKACNVTLRVAPTDLNLRSDPVLVRRMLQNLVSNAIRHSEGQTVLIGARLRNGRVSLQVCDTGKGIPDAERARIFEEFARLDSARMGEKATPGLGLGLSIVQRVADELGLSVNVKSHEGKGSIFSINGFERVDAAQDTELQGRQATGGKIDRARVVVLDDDPATLAATELLLKRWGCTVRASHTADGLADLDPDVIICDYELSPEVTGLDVIDGLAGTPAEGVPAIIISGHTSKALQMAVAKRGIPLLHKPIRPAQLRSALLNALANSDKSSGASQ